MNDHEIARSITFDLERAADALRNGRTNSALVLVEIATTAARALAENDPGDRFECGPLAIDVPTHTVTLHGEVLPIGGKQFEVLAVLASDPYRLWSKRVLYERCWDANLSETSRSLDTTLCRLRVALGGGYVYAVKGVGYRLCVAAREAVAA